MMSFLSIICHYKIYFIKNVNKSELSSKWMIIFIKLKYMKLSSWYKMELSLNREPVSSQGFKIMVFTLNYL